MKPIYKIETDKTGSVLYTIEDKVTDLRIKHCLTDNVGTFSFAVPTKLDGTSFIYTEIDLYDKVKIWLGWDSLPTNPLFVGKIHRIEAPISMGYQRIFKGRDLGEVLQRRTKNAKRWEGIGVSTIVTELATTDLGLGLIMDDPPDTTPVTMTVEDEIYFNIMATLSDYWYDADTQIKKDFYVDEGDVGHPNGHLVWKARPIRTVGVETIEESDMIQYTVLRDILPVKNKITIYGAYERTWSGSVSNDGWTESEISWTSNGTPATSTSHVFGSYSITAQMTDYSVWLQRTFSALSAKFTNEHKKFLFWFKTESESAVSQYDLWVYIFAPDSDNYVRYFFPKEIKSSWIKKEINIGPGTTADFTWGNPDWGNIQGVKFSTVQDVNDKWLSLYVDGVHFISRCYNSAESSSSQNSYGLREMVQINDILHNDAECQKRAKTLLYQLKDPPIRLDFQINGNSNVLIGDRLPITMPAENFSATNFDVLTVEHILQGDPIGWRTNVVALNSAELVAEDFRKVIPATNINEFNIQTLRDLKKVAKGMLMVK